MISFHIKITEKEKKHFYTKIPKVVLTKNLAGIFAKHVQKKQTLSSYKNNKSVRL